MANVGPAAAVRPGPDYRVPRPGERPLVFAGSAVRNGTGEPWWALGEITVRTLAPQGYEVTILSESWGWLNPRYVGDGRADIGSTMPYIASGAFNATGACEGEGKRDHLRAIVTVCRPCWTGVAITRKSGITDMAQLKERRIPLRMLAGVWADELLHYYGLSREEIVSYGGENVDGRAEKGGRKLDLMIDNLYLANTPAASRWLDASVANDLRFLDLPDDFIDQQVARGEERGFIPHGYLPGVDHDVRTVAYPYLVIYTRDDAPDELVRTLAQACDENRDYFRQSHINFSYDPNHVARHARIPLHRAALAYYEERGYPLE